MTTDLTIIRKENIDLIVSSAPAAYTENTVSRDRCLDAGGNLLTLMQQGMTDELDQQAAVFIEKARKTVKKMNEKRAPLTKLFDEIRANFTSMENDIDATKAGTIPFLIQQERNRYAAKKREEELARQREAMRQQQEQQYRNEYFQLCQNTYRQAFNALLNKEHNALQELFRTVTLENYAQRLSDIKAFHTELPATFATDTVASIALHRFIPANESRDIRVNAMNPLFEDFKHNFHQQMQACQDSCLSLMPSKLEQLQRAAEADAAEAERIEKQLREADERRMAEQQQQLAEQQQKSQIEADMKAAAQQTADLFNKAEASKPVYQPNTSVKKKLVPLNAEAFPEIIALWWKYEGSKLTVEDLSKIFKKQITFCEKLANDKTRPELIQSEHLSYEEEVKAK